MVYVGFDSPRPVSLNHKENEMLFILLTLEAGFMFQDRVSLPGQGAIYQTTNEMNYTLMHADAVFMDLFFVGAGVKTYQSQNSALSYKPHRAEYSASAGIRYNGFELGVYHECLHMIDQGSFQSDTLRGGETRAYIQYQGKLEVF